jgi:hypothetical protein
MSASDTHEAFLLNCEKALALLFWMGLQCQKVFPSRDLDPSLVKEMMEKGLGQPGPMLSVSGKLSSVFFIKTTFFHF